MVGRRLPTIFSKGELQMTDEKIKRINELSRKSKAEGLTPEEAEEQKKLRKEYVAGFRSSLTDILNNTSIMDEKGNKTPLKKKSEK